MDYKKFLSKLFQYLFLIVISALSLLPIVCVVMSSFKNNKEILDSAVSLPSSLFFDNFITAFKITNFKVLFKQHFYFLDKYNFKCFYNKYGCMCCCKI